MANDLTKRDEQRAEAVAQRPTVAPNVDIYENKDELLLIADMPGVAEGDLRVHLDEAELTIEGAPASETFPTALGREYRPAAYKRSFTLPDGIDRDKVSAQLKSGVLWLHLPKSAAVKPRRIDVKAG